MTACPHCGQPMPSDSGVSFFAETGMVICNGVIVQLSGKEATTFQELFSAWPRFVSHDALQAALYDHVPDCDQPNSDNIVRVWISKLRKRLTRVGLGIEAGWWGTRRYRLVIPELEAKAA